MNTAASAKEREILRVMRRVLAAVIRDTTPPRREMRHPLSPETIEEVRLCLALIAARERELADAAGLPRGRPRLPGDSETAPTVPLSDLERRDT